MGKVKSLFSDEKLCWLCGSSNVHKHHIFFGPNRKLSEKYGCFVYLCPRHHNMSDYSVHFNRKLDLSFKQECQRRWVKKYGDGFEKIFGRNYL